MKFELQEDNGVGRTCEQRGLRAELSMKFFKPRARIIALCLIAFSESIVFLIIRKKNKHDKTAQMR